MTQLFFLAALYSTLGPDVPADPDHWAQASYEPAAVIQEADDQPVVTGDTQPAPLIEDEEPEADTEAETLEPIEDDVVIDTRPERSREQELARLTEVFLTLDTMQAQFVQTNVDGSQDSGQFYLDRPGRIRFDYADPSPVLLVADGSTVAIADSDLETVDRVPVGQTPFKWLLDDTLDLASSGAVNEVGRYDGQLYLTLVDPDGDVDGRLTLVFDDPDPSRPSSAVRMTGWYAIDALNNFTEVRLSDIETGVRLDPRLFILDDDFGSDRRRTRR